MKIRRTDNSGIPARQARELDIHNFNIYPEVITATAAGIEFNNSWLENYDTFQIQQDSADTDFITLKADLPIGTQIQFYGVGGSNVTIESEVGSGIGFNGGAEAQGIVQQPGALTVFRKLEATNWLVSRVDQNGNMNQPGQQL